MDTKNPDKLPAKGIHQTNEYRGLQPSDSERQNYFNVCLFR